MAASTFRLRGVEPLERYTTLPTVFRLGERCCGAAPPSGHSHKTLHNADRVVTDTSHHVVISGSESQRRFLEVVGASGTKIEQAKRLATWLSLRKPNTNVDTLPQECFEDIKRP